MKRNVKKNNKKLQRYNGALRSGYALGPTITSFERPSVSWLDPHKYATLVYAEAYSNSVATTAGFQQTLNLNSLFDPNRTGAGHQPYGFDQLAALYNRYRVLSAHWKVTYGSSTGTMMLVTVPVNGLLQASISNQATYETAVESPFAIMKTQSSGAPAVVFEGTMSLNVLNGVTKTEYLADDRFEAAVTASPTEIITLVTGGFNPTGSTIVQYYLVEIWYEVDFHDPISQAAS